jgi:hypothetical protein
MKLLIPAALLALAAALVAPRIAAPRAPAPPADVAAAATPAPANEADPPPAVPEAVASVADPPTAPAPPARTKKPSFAAWKTAPEARLARAIPACKAQQIAEWLRIRCDIEVSSATLLAGDPRDVSFASLDRNAAFSVVLPLRPGDRRVIQLNYFFSFSKWGASEAGAAEISEMWLPGAAGPVVVVN